MTIQLTEQIVVPPHLPSSPWLKTAVAQSTSSVTLQFEDTQDFVDRYILEYGTEKEVYKYSANDIGGKDTTSYTINYLQPNKKYYFRIRAGNGCAVGPWSDEISVITHGFISTNNLQITDSTLETTQDYTNDEENTEEEQNNVLGYSLNVFVEDIGGNPVEGAEVTIHSKVQTAKTNKDGIASFNNVEEGEHRVLIAYNNFKGEESINLTADSQTKQFDLNITIEPKDKLFSGLGIWIVSLMGVVMVSLGMLVAKNKRSSKNE